MQTSPNAQKELRFTFTSRLDGWDKRLSKWIGENRVLKPFSRLFAAATYLGDGYLWGLIALLLLLFGRSIDRKYILLGLGIFIINKSLVVCFKFYFKRERPVPLAPGLRSLIMERYSFPSGHSTDSFGIALMVSYFYPALWVQLGAYSISLLISLSRIYVKEHYPSDVISGALLGTLMTAVLLFIFERVFL